MDLQSLIKPRTIAVVGVSESPNRFGYFAAKNALFSKEHADVYFVNLKHEFVLGEKVYRTLRELPNLPDLVILTIPKTAVAEVLRAAGELGVKAAVVVASGYSEEHTERGRLAEAELVQIASEYDMALLGPNCIGMLNYADRINAFAFGNEGFDVSGRKTGVALFAQSGKVSSDLAGCAYLNFSFIFSMGNCAVLGLEALMEAVIEREDVHVLGIYLEGLREPKRFMKILARAKELGKTVVVHKAGLSMLGAKSAASHTGNLAGSRTAYEAVFRKYSVLMVENKDEFICALDLMSCWYGKMPQRANFAGYNESGGDNAVMADLCEKYGVKLAEFSEETISLLKDAMPEFATPSNPLDAVGGSLTGTFSDQSQLYRILSWDEHIDALILGSVPFFAGDQNNDRIGQMILEYANCPGSKPVLVMPSLEGCRDSLWRGRLGDAGIPIMGSSDIGYRVLGKASALIGDKLERTTRDCVPIATRSEMTETLSEYEAKEILSELHLPMPKYELIRTKEHLNDLLPSFRFPIVMKISSRDIMHKTDAGGVRIGIEAEADAMAAYDEIMRNCTDFNPKAVLDGVLVQEMAERGTEMIVGIVSDETFGPLMMVGMGGIFVELFQDVAFYPCPMSETEAEEMIGSLRVSPIFDGFRGSEPCDVRALANMMAKLSEFAAVHCSEWKELDLNPVFLYPEGEGISVIDTLLVRYV